MKFEYKAKSQQGDVRTGMVVAADQVRAEQLLSETNPDALSPKEALDLLYRLKGLKG